MSKILIITQEKHTGLTYHRQIVPHNHLERNYKWSIIYGFNINDFTDEQLKSFSIVCFLRLVSEKGETINIINRCKKNGCKVIIDIDDYWNLPKWHELYELYKKYNITEQTIDGLVNADCITTTTPIFASKIRVYNKNVHVIPNTIDPLEYQFSDINKTYSDRIRLGWIGGLYHAKDIRLIYEGIDDVFKKVNNKEFQFCLGGYSTNQQYTFFEQIFTNNYKNISKEYTKYLLQKTEESNFVGEQQPYRRLWGKSVFEYAKMYNEIDISLVPLHDNDFNNCKSQIKIIEAGYFKKSVIVSDVEPYILDCNRTNSILIKPSKRNEGWNTAMRSFIKNEDKRNDFADALHELVMDKYLIDKANIYRNQLYKELCK